jgi:two-component system LytT family response regulator
MKSLRAIIVEDEPTGIENLRFKLNENCPEIEIVAECLNGKDAVRQILEDPSVVYTIPI